MMPERLTDKKLGEILTSKGLVTPQQVDEALELQRKEGCLIGEALVKLNYVTEEAIAWALTVQFGFPYLPLAGYEIDKDTIAIIPYDLAKEYGVIGIDKIGSVFTIAMSNPLKWEIIQKLEELTHCKVQIFISTLTEVQDMIQKHYGREKPASAPAEPRTDPSGREAAGGDKPASKPKD